MLDPLRPRAATAIAVNARLLEQTPTRRRDEPPRRRSFLEPLSSLPGGVAEGLEKHLQMRAPPAANNAERAAKRLTKAHLKGVGYVGDAMELASAEDKSRAVAGIVGGRVGGAVAGFIPPQLLTIPMGALVGSWAGQQAYDRRGPLVDAAKAELATLRDQLGRELKRYAPYDLPDRIARR
jgi:hypothetical protein